MPLVVALLALLFPLWGGAQSPRYAVSLTSGGTLTALVAADSLLCGHIAAGHGRSVAVGGSPSSLGRVVNCSASPVALGSTVTTVNGSLTSPGLGVVLTVSSIVDMGQVPVTVGANVVAVSSLGGSSSGVVTFGASVVPVVGNVSVTTGGVRVDSSLALTDFGTALLSTFVLSCCFLFTVMGLQFGRTR